MPRNEASETRKRHVVALLEQCLGPLCLNHPHRTDWHISEDGAVEVFITDSKAHFRQRPWFDMKAADLKELARHPAGFVLFILGDDTHFLVIPARDIVAQIPNHRGGLQRRDSITSTRSWGHEPSSSFQRGTIPSISGRLTLSPKCIMARQLAGSLIGAALWFSLIAQIVHIRALLAKK